MNYILSIRTDKTTSGWRLLDRTIRAPIKPILTREKIRRMFSSKTDWNQALLNVIK